MWTSSDIVPTKPVVKPKKRILIKSQSSAYFNSRNSAVQKKFSRATFVESRERV